MKAMLACGFLLCSSMAAMAANGMPGVIDSEFSPLVTIAGLPTDQPGPSKSIRAVWFLKSLIDKKTGAIAHIMDVSVFYHGEWAFYDKAEDDQTKSLTVMKVGSSILACFGGPGCSLKEDIGVVIPDDELRSRAATGFKVKIAGKSGSPVTIAVSPETATKQIKAIDQQEALLTKANAVPIIDP